MCSVILDQVVFGILHLNLASEAILILPQVQPIITDTCAFEGFYRTYFHAITHTLTKLWYLGMALFTGYIDPH